MFKGKAPKPTYVYIHDDQFELLDASEVWGKGVHDTVKHFKDKYGEKDLTVIAIGPAGENLVKFACWDDEDDRASGRGGTGCVGGSKNLKAIVIKAEKKLVKAADRDKWKEAHKKALAEIMDERVVTSPRKGGLSVYGTNVLMNMTNVIGGLPAINSQFTGWDHAENVSGEYVNDNILVDNPTCLTLGLLVGVTVLGSMSGALHPPSIAAGGAVMLVNFHLLRMLVSLLIRPGLGPWAHRMDPRVADAEAAIAVVLVAGVLYQFPVAPVSFAVGSSMLVIAAIFEAVIVGEPLEREEEARV